MRGGGGGLWALQGAGAAVRPPGRGGLAQRRHQRAHERGGAPPELQRGVGERLVEVVRADVDAIPDALPGYVALRFVDPADPGRHALSSLARKLVALIFGRLDARQATTETTAELMNRYFPAEYELAEPGTSAGGKSEDGMWNKKYGSVAKKTKFIKRVNETVRRSKI